MDADKVLKSLVEGLNVFFQGVIWVWDHILAPVLASIYTMLAQFTNTFPQAGLIVFVILFLILTVIIVVADVGINSWAKVSLILLIMLFFSSPYTKALIAGNPSTDLERDTFICLVVTLFLQLIGGKDKKGKFYYFLRITALLLQSFFVLQAVQLFLPLQKAVLKTFNVHL